LNYSSGTLQEEQERELSPENESERQVQEAAPAKAIKHFLHPDIVRFAMTAYLPEASKAVFPAFSSLYKTTGGKSFPLAQLGNADCELLSESRFH
ncbi:hypothetical protein B0A48_18895, partial [Cryoendolithus antarcticus]